MRGLIFIFGLIALTAAGTAAAQTVLIPGEKGPVDEPRGDSPASPAPQDPDAGDYRIPLPDANGRGRDDPRAQGRIPTDDLPTREGAVAKTAEELAEDPTVHNYIIASIGWHVDQRCHHLAGRLRREYSWNIAQLNQLLPPLNSAIVDRLQKVASSTANTDPQFRQCGPQSQAAVFEAFDTSRILLDSIDAPAYQARQSDREYYVKMLSSIFYTINVGKYCNVIPAEKETALKLLADQLSALLSDVYDPMVPVDARFGSRVRPSASFIEVCSDETHLRFDDWIALAKRLQTQLSGRDPAATTPDLPAGLTVAQLDQVRADGEARGWSCVDPLSYGQYLSSNWFQAMVMPLETGGYEILIAENRNADPPETEAGRRAYEQARRVVTTAAIFDYSCKREMR